MSAKWLIILVFILLLHGFILTRLIFFPYPELFVYPYLTNQGLVPYQQIFDQHFPGLMFLPINFDNLGMRDEVVARWWLITTVLLTQILIFWIGLKIFKDVKKALLANLLYLIWQPFLEGWVLWIDTFLPLFLLPAFYFTHLSVTGGEKRNVILVGFFLSLALLFKQVILPLIGLVFLLLFFYRRSLKMVAYFLLGLLPIPLVITFYFWSLGIIRDVWFWTVVFNLTTFAQYGRKYPFFTGVVRLVGIYSPILLLPLIKERKLMMTLLVFIIGSLAAAYARFDFIHFQPSLPFVALATSVVFFKLGEFSKARFLIAAYALIAVFWLVIFYKGHLGSKVFFFDDQTSRISGKIKQYTSPKEEIFLFGPVPHLYQMSNTLPAGNIFVFQFPWFMMETEGEFLAVLQNNPPNLVVRDRTVVIEERYYIGKFALKLDEYIEKTYETFDKVDRTEFMRRKE